MFIQQDKLDNYLFKEIRNNCEAIPKLEAEGQPRLSKWPEVVRDIWSGLYKMNPQIEESAEGPLAKAMQEVMETQEWKNLRNHTRLDELGSAIGTSSFGKNFLDNMPEEVLKAEQAHQDQQRAQAAQKAIEENPGEYSEAFKRRIEKAAQDANIKAVDAMAAAQKATDGNIEQAVRIAARGAAEQAATDANESKQFASSWGQGEGSGSTLPLSEQLKLAHKLRTDPSLSIVAKLIGRMKRMAQAMQASKISRCPDEVVDVETGNDLRNVLPSELAKLCHPATKRGFYRAYANRELLQYKKEGKEKAGRGPIVVMIDESGSMSGQPIAWAKAVGMGMAWIAQKQKRSVVLGGFSDGNQCWTKEYPNGNISTTELEAFAKQFYCGGTNFELALGRCIQVIRGAKVFKKADILFISDGECYVSKEFKDAFKQQKKELGFRVYCVGVGVSADSFKDFSDAAFGFNGALDKDVPALERIFSV